MSACPQCGTAARPTDKFCNACGTPITRFSTSSAPAPGDAPYGTPTPSPYGQPSGTPGFGPTPGNVPPAICQMGHEIVAGASYCAQGHPIALDQMDFTGGPYPSSSSFGAPPPAAGGYGAPTPLSPVPGFDMPPPLQASLPPLQSSFAAPPAPAYGRSEAVQALAPPTALRGFLVAFGNNPSGDFWPLTGGRLTIGRFGSADRIDIGLSDPTISSRHAAMHVDATSGTITVEDTSSTNGTFVNDEHVGFNGRRELRDGDRLRFGAYTTIVKVIGRV